MWCGADDFWKEKSNEEAKKKQRKGFERGEILIVFSNAAVC
jgi:uncharacterized protein YheU (UPF0270 family)